MSNLPRTKDTQATPTRPARSHHSKQRATKYTINGTDLETHFARYVTQNYPTTPVETRKRFVKVLMYAAKSNQPIPSPTEMNQLFEGEYTEPSTVALNSRQNG